MNINRDIDIKFLSNTSAARLVFKRNFMFICFCLCLQFKLPILYFSSLIFLSKMYWSVLATLVSMVAAALRESMATSANVVQDLLGITVKQVGRIVN